MIVIILLSFRLIRRDRLTARAAVTVRVAHEASRTSRLRRRLKHRVQLLFSLHLLHVFRFLPLYNLLSRLDVLLYTGALLVNAVRDGRATSPLIVLAADVAFFLLDHVQVSVRRRASVGLPQMLHPLAMMVRVGYPIFGQILDQLAFLSARTHLPR